MWPLHSLRFRDEEYDGAYSDLDLETNGSDPDYKPLSSEEMCSFGQDSNIWDIIVFTRAACAFLWMKDCSHLSESQGV